MKATEDFCKFEQNLWVAEGLVQKRNKTSLYVYLKQFLNWFQEIQKILYEINQF